MNNIKLIVLDVDGTMTDGGVYIDSNGVEIKRFCVQDGAGILLARKAGIKCMILTGRKSVCVEKRAKELRMEYVFQGVDNKAKFLTHFIDENKLSEDNIAYIGDDLNDLYAMRLAGFKACPQNGADEIKKQCDYIAHSYGGSGAVREIIEQILKGNGLWDKAIHDLFAV